MDRKEIIERYVELKKTEREIKDEMEVLQDQIKAFTEVDDQYDLEEATVTYAPGRLSYVYSPELTAQADQVKEAQKSEIKTGIAEGIPGTPYLIVKFKKHG